MDKPLSLSTASASWVQDEDDNKWIVKDQDGVKLGEFPRKWKAKDCMIAIRLGRKYELEAFNKGIEFGKAVKETAHKPIIAKLSADIKELAGMNERLSTQLEKFIIGEE